VLASADWFHREAREPGNAHHSGGRPSFDGWRPCLHAATSCSALPVQLRGLLQLPPGRTERARILRSGYFAILVPDDHSVHGRHLGRDGRDAGAMQHGKQRCSKSLELLG